MRQIALKIFGITSSSREEERRKIRWLPWLISSLAVGYVIYRLANEDVAVWATFWPLSASMLAGVSVAVILFPVNWFLESEKWRILIRTWYPDTTMRFAFQAVLVGLSTGIFTPNRLGEYPGRIMTLPPGSRWEAAAVMLLDRMFQMVVTCWLGVASLWLILPDVPESWASWLEAGLPWITAIAIMLPAGIPLALKGLSSIRTHAATFRRMSQATASLPLLQLLLVFGLSLIRNLVFTSQYVILLYACGLDANLGVVLPLIWTIFLLKSLAPAWTITELGIRETLAITVLGFISVAPAIAFSATFLLYLINLILPALIGLRWVHRISWS